MGAIIPREFITGSLDAIPAQGTSAVFTHHDVFARIFEVGVQLISSHRYKIELAEECLRANIFSGEEAGDLAEYIKSMWLIVRKDG